MKKYSLSLLIIIFGFIQVFAQHKKGMVNYAANDPHQLYVVFDGSLTSEQLFSNPELKKIIENNGLHFVNALALTEGKIKQMAKKQSVDTTNSLNNLKNVYKLKEKKLSNEQLKSIALELEKLSIVKYCHLSPVKLVLPPVATDIAPETPNFFNQQTYLQSNPGVDMQYAWDMGYNGQGIRFRDIEYGMNPNHEDFINTNIQLKEGMPIHSIMFSEEYLSYVQHGTSVAGMIKAGNNNYGITGMAYGASEFILYPEYTQDETDRLFAISKAIEDSKAGDVVIYEMQTQGENIEVFVPAEYDPIVWDLTKAATSDGIIIVAAAGNYRVNLDSSFYAPYMERGDSGAIIVGGGSPDINHSRVYFSNYGSRVDIQGWAENVFTTGEGTFNSSSCVPTIIGSDLNQAYTPCFRGTSSATPMVAGCAGVLQSYYFSQTGNYLTPLEMRNILKTTGIPQGSGGNIGSFPNMKAAIEKINTEYLLGINTDSFETNIVLYPNPAEKFIRVTLPEYFSTDSKVEIYNAVGQKMIDQNIVNGTNEVLIDDLLSGVYVAKVYDGNHSVIKRFTKK